MKYLMICLGNICRSPMAEGILRKKLSEAGSNSVVASRGFETYHDGDYADKRAQFIARMNDVDLSKHKAKLFVSDDFDNYDYIFVMDAGNYRQIEKFVRTEEDMKKVDYLMNVVYPGSKMEVPDPYYGENQGFLQVWQMISQACDAIIQKYE